MSPPHCSPLKPDQDELEIASCLGVRMKRMVVLGRMGLGMGRSCVAPGPANGLEVDEGAVGAKAAAIPAGSAGGKYRGDRYF
jgi:hypothetical protein